MAHELHIVDAFTTRPLEGNPCAVVFDADDLSSETMQRIALEMHLSETAFVLKARDGGLAARYFTPAEEIPLAGHPTIATIHALVESGRLELPEGASRVSLELRDGPIAIDVEIEGGRALEIIMTQRKPRFLTTWDPSEILPLFGLDPEDVSESGPIQTVSTGTPQLMIPLRNHDALRRAEIQTGPYRKLRERADFFSPHLFCLRGATEAGDTFARHFGVPPDTLEDPFTGSATGGMAAWLWHHGAIDEPRFIAEQGHWMGRPGRASVTIEGERNAIEYVRVGGTAVTFLRGTIAD